MFPADLVVSSEMTILVKTASISVLDSVIPRGCPGGLW